MEKRRIRLDWQKQYRDKRKASQTEQEQQQPGLLSLIVVSSKDCLLK